jgi:hypothetical protein
MLSKAFVLSILKKSIIQCHCYNFAHENIGNPALNTRPKILNNFCGFLIL